MISLLSVLGLLSALGCTSPDHGYVCDCIVNTPPGVLTISGPLEIHENQPADYQLTAIDPEADAITFSTTTANAVIHGATLTFTPVAIGQMELKFFARDAKGAISESRMLMVTVLP
jgi:hypothetical protein